MAPQANWETISPRNLTGYNGLGADNGSGTLRTGVTEATPAANHPPLYSPDNPLFWFALILGATAGLFALSVNVKAGPAKAAASI